MTDKQKKAELLAKLLREVQGITFLSEKEKTAMLERVLESDYIDLTVDYGFKYVFGQHPELLRRLLEDILELDIDALEYLPEQLSGTLVQDRYIVMDVVATLRDGSRIVIEMQNAVPKDLRNRLVYYGSALIYNQLKRGSEEYNYKDVHVLIFLNGVLPHARDFGGRLLYRYLIRERDSGEPYGRQLQLTVCELPNLAAGSEETMSAAEKWCYYFRNMKNFTTLAGGPKRLGERYDSLIDASKTRRFSDDEWKNYATAMFTQREIDNLTQPDYERGLEDGFSKGRTEIAAAMKAAGEPVEKIALFTGLSADEIDKLD